jgi:chromosome segregation protein
LRIEDGNPQSAIHNPQFSPMLKALELAGFKSFADRTRFEFPRGVSVVVGPNGSGKSNVVDAVKWVLGSQSAKSLRGREMTDVIFNGSASRGPLGAGEATLTFDNSTGALPIEAHEVHVTRRVYRSGEGEYLINRQPCRLRDIRDLLAGTGITTEAYCIIEQGKVDVLLQASPRDRRVIFEEAAGISQFKAKKIAAARRIERVEQNLLRLSDIVDEVESRLRSVRMQAGKARRYREWTTRLQQLRTEVGLVDWRALTRQITAREERLAEMTRRCAEREAELARTDAEAQALERESETATERQRQIEAQASTTREQIAALEAAIHTQSARRTDIEQDVARIRRQLTAMSNRDGSTGEQLRDATTKLDAAQAEFALADREHRQQLDSLAAAQAQSNTLRATADECRTEQSEAVRNLTRLGDRHAALQARLQSTHSSHQQCELKLEQLHEQRRLHESELREVQAAHESIETQVEARQDNVRAAETRLAALREEAVRVEKQRRHLDARSTRTHERIAVLEELNERLEGLNSGVRDVLMAARNAPEGPLGEVRGVIADLFQVDVDTAPMIDAALGEQAEYLVLQSAGRLFDWLNHKTLGVGGRVGFLRLDSRPPADSADSVDLSGEPGVLGRADRFVESAADLVPLARRLLGRTWFVDRLATALRLTQTTGRGLSFVTTDGELLSADGTLVVGPRRASTGLLSRRSELHACRQQLADLERQLQSQQVLHARIERDIAAEEQQLAAARAQWNELLSQRSDHHHQAKFARSQLERLLETVERAAAELQHAAEDGTAIAAELQSTHDDRLATDQAAQQAQERLRAALAGLVELEERVASLRTLTTDRRVAAAKCEQRVEILQSQLAQAQRDEQAREEALAETSGRLSAREIQLADLDQQNLVACGSLADLFVHKEQLARDLSLHLAATVEQRTARQQLQERSRQERSELGALQSQQHKLELAVNKLRHERQTLGERMQDDYGINLEEEARSAEHRARNESSESDDNSSLPAPGSLLPASRDSIEREIADLRDQINQIGAVNLDALAELDDLETRFGGLSQQYRDLVDAKAALERIIQRINIDSRQLFLATLETVRGHFHELFRQLFGGGEADIVIDEGEDVLECGIEIVACPPGKEACNISLLSGGEKTLTCVALLLAVFRSKPSPFCILDEVDAALDEANIGRFTQVLRDFLSFTQFIVVTHSKKSMSGADTLYGITMEESGVSKHVSVRFEDVSEDGHILPSGLRKNSPSPPASDDSMLRRAA